MKKKEVAKVIQDAEAPVERNVLAASIVEISKSVKKLLNGGLNRDAIITLIAAKVKAPTKYGTKPTKGDVVAVLNALANLEKEFCS